MAYDVVVVGATLAGHLVARALCRKGFKVGLSLQGMGELALHDGLVRWGQPGLAPQQQTQDRASGWQNWWPERLLAAGRSVQQLETFLQESVRLLALPDVVMAPIEGQHLAGPKLHYWLDATGRWRSAAAGWFLGQPLQLNQPVVLLDMADGRQSHFLQRAQATAPRLESSAAPIYSWLPVPMPGNEAEQQGLRQHGNGTALRALLRTQAQWQAWLEKLAAVVPKGSQVVLPHLFSLEPGQWLQQYALARDCLQCSISLFAPCQQFYTGLALQNQLQVDTTKAGVTLLDPIIEAEWHLDVQGYHLVALRDKAQAVHTVQAAVLATDHILGGGLQSSGHGAREPVFDLDADAPRAGPWYIGQSSALPQFQATIRIDAQHAPSKEGVRIWNVGLAGGCSLKQQDLLDPCADLLAMVGAMEAATRMERLLQEKRHVA